MARIYQWNAGSDGQLPYAGHALLYDSEDKNGTYCMCGFCNKLINIDHPAVECPECHNHLVFPRAEW